MADLRSPLASAGVAGITTLSPGTWAAQASRLPECCGPAFRPAPMCVRSTSGRRTWPPNMYRIFAIWLTTWSQQVAMKSMNMTSTTGRRPFTAAPIAAPTIAVSLMGVSRTRSFPNCW